MFVSNNKNRLHIQFRYALSGIPTEFERIQLFAKGSSRYSQEAKTSLVLDGGTFKSIMDHTHMIRHIRHDRQGSGKRFYKHGQFSGPLPHDRGFKRQGHQVRKFRQLFLHSTVARGLDLLRWATIAPSVHRDVVVLQHNHLIGETPKLVIFVMQLGISPTIVHIVCFILIHQDLRQQLETQLRA